ncbi:tetratricopeptide repeat protein [Paraburkholderia sp. ZP32-5]|uniref:tetratricopeptide repeat protein n=1 Tax=Paraburkholderia sp. ZP32-5 TaxID=2883245 RepID=UPI001F417EEF|nr:tetratricopeptide repeat protein [Paraburkholderia sp. ZP32-5]
MANEIAKQMLRRGNDQRFFTRWLSGDGIDISTEPGSLSSLSSFFPLVKSLRNWQQSDGDAMLMGSVADDTYDFVHASHYLARMDDPLQALGNWIRICKPGGHLIITAPDEDLYEQGVWPSTFNTDHKWSFTIHKPASWSPRSISLLKLSMHFQDEVEVLKIEKLDAAFKQGEARFDQSSYGLAESAIELVLRKRERAAEAGSAVDSVEATFALATIHHQAGQTDEALEGYKAVLQHQPEHLPALNNLALLLSSEKRERLLRQALSIKQDDPGTLQNLAMLLAESGRFGEAKDMYERALQVLPDDSRVVSALCDVYVVLDELDAAISLLESKAALFSTQDQVYCLLGKYCQAANRIDDALAYLSHALVLNPEHIEAHILRGRLLWKKGDYESGASEIRWVWHAHAPELREQTGLFTDAAGEPIRQDGRTIVLTADGGAGDTLQFARYAKLLNEQGARVILECPDELARVLRGIDGVDEVVGIGQLPATVDARVPMHNLIGAFRTTLSRIPADVPYVHIDAADVARWRERLEPHTGLRVGLYWDDHPKHWRDLRRSVTVEQMLTLPALPGANYFTLRQGLETPVPALIDWSSELNDLADTAALIANLDLVITVDSAIAHLAGALGTPVWLLSRFDAEWVWLDERVDSPWYPNLTLFRQARAGDWAQVLASVSVHLAQWIVARAKPAAESAAVPESAPVPAPALPKAKGQKSKKAASTKKHRARG